MRELMYLSGLIVMAIGAGILWYRLSKSLDQDTDPRMRDAAVRGDIHRTTSGLVWPYDR